MNWMEKQATSEIQTAIQSQTIQTALEANTSKITDAGFQSYLTNAPIPRFTAPTITGTYAAGNTVANFSQTGYHDPYQMFVPATGMATVPIDGYYVFAGYVSAVTSAGAYINISFIDAAGTALVLDLCVSNAANIAQTTISQVLALKQGATVRMNVGNGGAANLSSLTGGMGAVWSAPYNTYVGGNNG